MESGGHGSSIGLPLLILLPAVLTLTTSSSPPIIAAGGLANGAQIASILTMGASGVVLGTRFLLTPESLYTDAQRSALLAAGHDATVRTSAFDHIRGTLGWPGHVDGRAMMNS